MTTEHADSPSTEQLSLLPRAEVPAQFRLDRRTCERGLAHIAHIRQMLASRALAQPANVLISAPQPTSRQRPAA